MKHFPSFFAFRKERIEEGETGNGEIEGGGKRRKRYSITPSPFLLLLLLLLLFEENEKNK